MSDATTVSPITLDAFRALSTADKWLHLRQHKIPRTNKDTTGERLTKKYDQFLTGRRGKSKACPGCAPPTPASTPTKPSYTSAVVPRGSSTTTKTVHSTPRVQTEFQRKLQEFNNCGHDDVKCMLFAIGLDPERYNSLLRVDCKSICARSQQTAVPLAVVVDPSSDNIVAVQAKEGVVPVAPTDLSTAPTVAPIVLNPSRDLLWQIQHAPKQLKKTSDRLISAVPHRTTLTSKPIPGGLLVGVKNSTDPPRVVDLLGSRLQTIRDKVGLYEDTDDDDDDDEDDWV